MKCENEDCPKTAIYGLFKTFPDGEKKWLNVCRECDRKIGAENLRRVGGYIKKSKR